MDIKKKIKKIPHAPGVYFFYNKSGKILYIGKAVDLKRRISSYFQKKDINPKLRLLTSSIHCFDYLITSSEAEALIHEASLIKQHQPKYNIVHKDDKTYPYLKLTIKEKFPRLIITRKKDDKKALYYGPYTNSKLLRQAFVFIKRVFKLRTCNKMPKKSCLRYHLKHCLAPCVIPDTHNDYRETIKGLRLFLSGRKGKLVDRLTKRMNECTKNFRYEQAMATRDQIQALTVLIERNKPILYAPSDMQDLKSVLKMNRLPFKIEAFDISNIQGKYATGSMVSFVKGQPDKNEYRRFRIKAVKQADDFAMIKEVVRRRYARLKKENRKMPDLVIIDGGKGQLSSAYKALKELNLDLKVISIAKNPDRIFTLKKQMPLVLSRRQKAFKLIQRIRDEAHRFAIRYHHLLRGKAYRK